MSKRRKFRHETVWVAGPVHPGFVFDTDFEKGCVATSEVDQFGTFVGRDSEGVEVQYSVEMVIGHPQYRPLEV